MVRTELDHLSDDVRQALRPAVDRVLSPGPRGGTWYFLGRPLPVESAVELRSALSAIMDDVFSASPVIMSEMVVRRRPSPVIINARKKVILGILERYSQEFVGIEGDFADKAIFRAVFLRSGLYRPEGERWRFADPSELEDPGLGAVWKRVAEFFSEPGSKSLHSLTHELMEPPFGVREGLLPVLIAAGIKAFPTPKAIRSRALFVTDLLPSTIEEMVRSPEDYTVDVVSLTPEQEDYLQDVLARFSTWAPTVAPNDDVIRKAYDAVQGWWEALPASAKATSSISAQARRFRSLIQRPDPVAVLLKEIPVLLGGSERDLSQAWEGLQACVDELEGMEKRFQASARAALASAMEARGLEVGSDIGESGRSWASFFPRALPLDSLSPVAKATLGQLRRTHDGERPLMNALALLVTGHALKDWTESTPPEFDRRLRTALEDIEHAALEAGRSAAVGPEVNEGLIKLSRARLRMTLRQLADLTGEDALKEIVAEALSSSSSNKAQAPQ